MSDDPRWKVSNVEACAFCGNADVRRMLPISGVCDAVVYRCNECDGYTFYYPPAKPLDVASVVVTLALLVLLFLWLARA